MHECMGRKMRRCGADCESLMASGFGVSLPDMGVRVATDVVTDIMALDASHSALGRTVAASILEGGGGQSVKRLRWVIAEFAGVQFHRRNADTANERDDEDRDSRCCTSKASPRSP